MTLADYRGKWVLVDFWGYWCGPCVRQLGELIDLYEDHAGERDKFEVLAFHDGTVKDFSEMDAKTEQPRKPSGTVATCLSRCCSMPRTAAGATVEAFGIQSFPTTILIDPEGKLVGETSPRTGLEEKLTPIPLAKRIPRALDRDVALGMDGGKLADIVKFLGRLPHPDQARSAAMEKAGIAPTPRRT